jgi:hypothetical protein
MLFGGSFQKPEAVNLNNDGIEKYAFLLTDFDTIILEIS